MKVPLELSFRDVEKTPELEDLIRDKVSKLERYCDHLNSCRVAVEKPQEHQRSGSPYRVRVNMTVPPGHELAVSREPGEGDLREEIQVAIRDAFDSAARQLKRLVDKQQGEVKQHPEQETMGLVSKLLPEEGYGFIQTQEGREIYFHRNSVLHDDFDRLETGTGVRYVEEPGEQGPQASTVQIVDKQSM
jgi:ribosomal subunit interface protein